MKAKFAACAAVAALVPACAASAIAEQMQRIGAPPEAMNMRLAGYNDLQARSAYQPTIVHQGDHYIAYIGHHGGTADVPKPTNPQTGQPEFNGTSIVDVTDPAHPKYLKHIPGTAGAAESGGAQMTRVCPGATLPRADRSQVLFAAHVRHQGARNLGRHRSEQSGAARLDRWRLQGHPQKLLGVRHRDRLSGLGRAGLARAADDRGLRPRRSGASGEDPRLRAARPGARRDRSGADRGARTDLARSAEQSDLFRLRHQQERHPADRRSRQAAQRAQGADAREPAQPGDRPP